MAERLPPPRYLVGIDLGTTHTLVAYADTADAEPAIRLFEIEQLVAPGEVAARALLPSLRYHPTPGELAPDDLRLPWSVPGQSPAWEPDLNVAVPHAVLGEWARELGSKVPGRLVVSAKSWLSHPSVDRSAPILPWGSAQDVAKISPVQASASYLAYVRAAWNWRFSEHPLEKQDIVLTVPASFDEVARTLTVEAARLVGLSRVRLVEEPQAACYDWLAQHHHELASLLGTTRLLLVCDVGGGTTDLTLIKIELGENEPTLTRIGVGDHLMLGGDNMDLTLAHIAEKRLVASGTHLSAAHLSQLIQQCRAAKERLLGPEAPERATVTLLGAGTQLVGGARSTELTRVEVQHLVLDGFFPPVGPDEQPRRMRGGIVEFGLPYVADPAVTRHVAKFLRHHAQVSREALGDRGGPDVALPVPDAVLVNGGVFHSASLAQRLLDVLATWRGAPLTPLHNQTPDLAVARGAVAYAMARRGQGLKIGGGSARSYFLLVEGKRDQSGVCLLPRGTQEGHEVRLKEQTFSLRLGQPVLFHLVSSTGDTPFRPGNLVDIDHETFTVLPPIATVLGGQQGDGVSVSREVKVQLAATLTEVGTLDVNCVATDDSARRWQLAFQLRGEGYAATVREPHPRLGDAAARIERIYGKRAQDVGAREVKTLRTDLEKILGKRDGWDTSLLRELFAILWGGVRHRRRSADHERLWFSLAGFCLRPGFGYPLDAWRVQQLWSLYDQGAQHTREARVWAEWWTLWRRVAGGLDEQAQLGLLDAIAYELQPPAARSHKRPPGPKKQGYDEMVRLVAALERLPVHRKVDVGEWLLERLRKPAESPQTWWAVGRLGARVPFYGSAHNVVPRETAMEWLEQLLALDWKRVKPGAFAATLLARMSGDRARDLEPDFRALIAQRLQAAKAPDSWIQMVQTVTQLDEADEKRVFGESLPPGLRLVH